MAERPPRTVALLVPGDLETKTGGYEYDRRMATGLRSRGWRVDVIQLDKSFPTASDDALQDAATILARLDADSLVLMDGLALGAAPDQVTTAGERLTIVALIHHPLAAETGLDARAAARLYNSERQALAAVRRVIVTSAATRAALASYGVAATRISVVEPGTDRGPLAPGSSDDVLRLLSVGAIVPRKGHDVLLQSLCQLTDRTWHLTCVGSLDRDPQWVAHVRQLSTQKPLQGRVSFVGEVDRSALTALYATADLFVLPTRYEGYGMAVAEALAHGLPVIGTDTGAIGDLVSSGAGILVTPGDARALADALRRVLDDDRLRVALRAAAREVRERLPSWDNAVRSMEVALEQSVSGGAR